MVDMSSEGGDDRSDIDIVIVLEHLDASQHRALLPYHLNLLKASIEAARTPLIDLVFKKETAHAVRFIVGGVRVDLLPTFESRTHKPLYEQRLLLIHFKASRVEALTSDLWDFCSVCFADDQTDFVKVIDGYKKVCISLLFLF